MTTGSIIIDSRHNENLNCGPASVGSYYRKTWSGGDQSPGSIGLDQHPYEMVVDSSYWPKGHFIRDNLTTFTGTLANCYGGIGFSSRWSSNDDLALIGKLRTRIAGSGFNAAVSLGEGKESLDMIFLGASRIYHAYKSLRRGRFSDAYRALVNYRDAPESVQWQKRKKGRRGKIYHIPRFNKSKFSKENTASNWLELQYGWLPLISDVHDAAVTLAALTQPRVYRVRARHFLNKPLVGAAPFVLYEGKHIERGQILAYLTEVNVPSLYGLTDPLSLAWELTPFSFVADWFIPIGDYLSARGLAQSISGQFVTTRFNTFEANFAGFRKGSGLVGFTATGQRKFVSVKRTVSSSLQVPLPEVTPLNQVLSWKRAANAVALLVNMFR